MEKKENNPAIRAMFVNMKPPSKITYWKIRVAMKLYKWKLIKGWEYAPSEDKCYIQWL